MLLLLLLRVVAVLAVRLLLLLRSPLPPFPLGPSWVNIKSLKVVRLDFGVFWAAPGANTLPTCSHNLWLHVGKMSAPGAAQKTPKSSLQISMFVYVYVGFPSLIS